MTAALPRFSLGRRLLGAAILLAFCSLAPARSSDSLRAPPISLYTQVQRSSSFDGCLNLFPGQIAIALRDVDTKWIPRGLCSNNFAALHSGLTKTPLLVVERLTRASIADAKGESRTDVFYGDPRLPRNERSDLADYVGSSLDRGHLAPAADQPDTTAMAQSFALSNIVPQAPVNNRKTWAKLESDVRKFAQRARGNVFVFSGPLFQGDLRTIGRNQVWVPSHLFKLVYDEAGGRAWAYILPNTDEARIEAPVDYPSFVKKTGWRLIHDPKLAAPTASGK